MGAKEISYEIIKHIGIISKRGMHTKEINIVSWNGRESVYDLRVWRIGKDGTKSPLKGISMNEADLLTLKELLSTIDLGYDNE